MSPSHRHPRYRNDGTEFLSTAPRWARGDWPERCVVTLKQVWVVRVIACGRERLTRHVLAVAVKHRPREHPGRVYGRLDPRL